MGKKDAPAAVAPLERNHPTAYNAGRFTFLGSLLGFAWRRRVSVGRLLELVIRTGRHIAEIHRKAFYLGRDCLHSETNLER